MMPWRQSGWKRACTYAVLLAWSFVCLLPLYWVFIASLKDEDAIIHGPRYVPFLDFTPNLAAWRFILLDSSENLLWPAFNSLVVSSAATAMAMCIACLLLYALTRLQRQNSIAPAWFLGLVLASRILPSATVVISLYLMAQLTGLLDSRTALILTYAAINLPVATWLLLPVFGKRATEQEEAGLLEGLSHVQILWGILLPMILPTLAAVALIVFILCWNEYFFAAYLTTNHASTLTPWMVGQLSLKEAQIGGEPEEWAHLSAATVFMTAPLLVFVTSVQRVLAARSISK